MNMKEMIEKNMKKQADIIAKEVNTLRELCDYRIESNDDDSLTTLFDYIDNCADGLIWAIGYKHTIDDFECIDKANLSDDFWLEEYCNAKERYAEHARQGGANGILNQACDQGVMDFIELHHPEALHSKKVE